MDYNTIKFKFDYDNDNLIDNAFENAKYLLNFQFDEDSNVFFIDTDVEYQTEYVSNLNSQDIEIITDSFFNFTFENTSNVFLYKFLVLKNNNKSTILAVIHPLIFNYASINDFYELFNNINSVSLKDDLNHYYDDVKDYLSSADYDNDSAYWRNIHSDARDYVKFHNLKSNNYKCHKIETDKARVHDFIKTHNLSIFDFHASAFSLYLSRINRQKGCLLKTTIPSKGAGLKTILKVDFKSDSSFADYLNQFNSIYSEAISHTKISIGGFMDEDLSYYSIYDFSDLNENIYVYNGDDSALTLNIHNNFLELVYNADLFSDIYIQHMADNIKSMINNLVEFPNQLLKDVNILSDNEKVLLSEFSKGDDADVDEDFLISGYFRKNALKNPDAIAIDDGVTQISYGELEKSSNSIANDLFENYNIVPDSHVALILPRNYHFPEMVLALNKIGAAFIHMDLIYPAKRIGHMLEISEAECIVTTKDIEGNFDFDLDIIYIEDLNSDDDVDFEIIASGENLFSIMFTSGTTGLPKAVMFSNHQHVGLYEAFKNIFTFSHGEIIGCYLSFGFLASHVIYLAFAFGGCCRIFNENEQKDILSLIKTLKEKPMNSLVLPPTVAIPVLESADIKLKYLILGGSKLKELSIKENHIQLMNFYGTTETSFSITKAYDLNDIKGNNVPIGRPVTNTNAYILDKHLNQMPIGVPGEICISSEYISPGYYNNPELTSEVFVDNPYSDAENNKRMYRTGDIGFYNFDGDIEIIGREDDQMSVRGFRIESGEILSIIDCIDEIENVYLDVENDTLALYYTTNAEIAIDFIKEKLLDELPGYMVPSIFMELEEIPLNMNGKIDKVRLKKMSKVNSEIDIEDEVLTGVVDAFKEILDTDLVLIDDDFVQLGGNSLSAMKLQILLKEKFAANLSSNEIIELSTPVNIANTIKFCSDNLEITLNYDFNGLCPLSESQLNVYLDEIANDMGTGYNNSFKIKFNNKYSVDKIKEALNKLFEVYPILSARVVIADDVPSFIFDVNPQVLEGSDDDIKTFVQPFNMEEYLARFLIVENDEVLTLCSDFHHLIFDGTSADILLDVFIDILEGNHVDFVDDGVLRQISYEKNDIVDSEYVDEAAEFFKNALADIDETSEMLAAVTDNNIDDEYVDYLKIDNAYLNSFLQENSITHNQFFTSVFAYVLSRFTGSSKVLFNLIEDGRGYVDLSKSVGMFVRTLPLLMDCENQNVGSFLEYSSKLVNSTMNNDLYPYRILANEYDLNSGIFFQYAHNIGHDSLNNESIADFCELKHDLQGDMVFYIFNSDENEYQFKVLFSDKFDKEYIKRFVESYKLILNEMTIVSQLSDIDYISDEDLGLLDDLNDTEHDLKYDNILDAFNDNLSKYPDNKLVSYEDKSYSYGEGAFIAERIAKSLTDLGVESQDCVGFLLPRSELYMFSVLGILSLGAVYVPLDDAHPDERVNFIINDSDVKVVIVNDETYSRAQDLIGNFNILNISDIIDGNNGSLDNLPVSYGELTCILYTSGTAGTPKGVKVTSKSILNLSHNYADKNNMGVGDVYGLYASIGFDAASQAICQTFYAGATLSVIPEDIRLNIEKLNEYMINQNINHVMMTTPVGKLFMENADNEQLDVLTVGGEKLGDFANYNDYKLIDGYGPTETFAFITSIDNTLKIDSSSIGMVNDNTKVYILDNESRRVPYGAVGELCISGFQVADGYLNREEETAKAFVNNPFEDDSDYGVLYRSGDMVRVLPDGSLGIVGRRDSQVKIRGNRVELSAIESVIREIEYINDVTVQTFKNNSNNELVAYVVVDKEWDDSIKDDICDYVAERKPEYMIPAYVIRLDEIPLNVNGKVDKRALPEVDIDSLSVEYVAPTNETEKIIVDAFEEVFDMEGISIYDDFTRLGGDSLTAISLLSYLSDLNISAGDILSLRTPHSIANSVSEVSLDLDIYSLDSGCPLNEPQLNVYLDIMANDKKDSYLIPFSMNIPSKYSVEDIKSALDVMLNVHPILQMCVSDDFDVPYLVKGSKPPTLDGFDIDDEFLTKPFDLHDSLCRFLIVDNSVSFVLFAVFHHIIFDALSIEVFKRDLYAVLEGEVIGEDDSFLKVSAFNQQITESSDYAEAEEFYESMLADIDDTTELLDSVLADGPGSISLDLDLDKELFASFLDKHNISENVLFSGVFAYNLSRFVASEKVFFNIVENGRSRFRNYDSIGMFVNTLPVVMDCKNRDINSFMDYMSDRIYGVMRYNYYPFRLLANKYNLNSDILFQFIPEWINETNDSDNKIIGDENDSLNNIGGLNSEFIVEIMQKGNNYVLNVNYSERYSKDFINHFIESYKFILNDMLDVDELCDINYISSDDLDFLDKINDNEHDLDYDDILDAFNDNLSKYPDNKLVSYEDKSYSYGEGAFIAQRIAKSLTDLGVESQDCVGFLVPRSELYMFSVLGTLSLGAVYVPLDDEHPDERLKFILEDSGCNAVIVNDETYQRLFNLGYDGSVLNVSCIINDDVDSLSDLPVAYGDLACILYTSGTAGIPKGVKITRKSIVNYIEYYVIKSKISNDDVFALYASIGFDVGAIKGIFVPIYSGACLDIIPKDIRLDMHKLNEHFHDKNITHAHFPTQVAKLFIDNVDNHSLDVLCTGGEKLGEVNYSCDYVFVDSYGPTEACVSVTAIKEADKIDSSSIGFLLDNLKAYVLDDEFRHVPVGAVGELYLSGIQLADGYLNREEETKKAFLNNPFENDVNYAGLYRTGDMVRVLPDGSLGIVGRRDNQVKIRGNRVELSAIEFVIREMDYIENVTVQTFKNNSNNELVAYVVLNKELDKEWNDIKEDICDYVSERKPEYMVPSFVIQLDEIPLNVNGKVDKRALPEVDMSSLSVAYVAPTSEIEEQIVNAFEVVFNQKGIGLYDDFIRLGGDSITAIRLISLLEKDGFTCSARDILNYKTPYLIAQNALKISKKSYDVTTGEVDLLPIQSYFFDNVNSNEFTQEFILKSKIDLDLDTLQNAFDELSNVHDMLRATYRYKEGSVVQEILPLNSHVCTIEENTTDDLEKTVKKFISESKKSIDISRDLVKISLIHHDSESYVVLVIHHLIIDGVSWSILIDDLTYIINQVKNNDEINLLRPYPYKNWVSDVRSLAEDISDNEKQKWISINNQLDDSLIKGKSKGFIFSLDAGFDVNNLLMISEEEYLALSIARAYKKTYNQNIIFNRESYGRDEILADVSRTVGWFTSQFPVLVDTTNKFDTVSLMSDVYTIKEAFKDVEHLGLNYESLIYTTNEMGYKHSPVTFNFLSGEFSFENELFKSVNPELSISSELKLDDLDHVTFGVSLNVSRADNHYIINGEYADGTYLADKFSEFIENIKHELEYIADYDSDVISCCLSESQLGIYLDEKVNEMGTAYSTAGILECPQDKSVGEIENAIRQLIDKHPVLKGRVVDGDVPLLVCDTNPSIKTAMSDDYTDLIKPFDLNESLARFYIIENNIGKFVFYDIHHIISDATSHTIINNQLANALDGVLDGSTDLGFVHAGNDSFDLQFESIYNEAHEFYMNMLSDIDDTSTLMEDVEGVDNAVRLPIHDVRKDVEAFCCEHGITVGNFLNAVFAYTYSRFTGGDKVYYNFTENGRHEDYTQNALGMFVRTIPVIVNCENKSVDEYLSDVSDLILDSMKYSVYPFRLLAHEFDLNNDVSFEYNSDLNDVSSIGDELVIEDTYIDLISDFLCVVNDLKDGYLVSVESSHKYSNDMIIRFLNAFNEILKGLLDCKILSDIDYISSDDLAVLDEINNTEHDLKYSDVLDAFNENLSKYPDNPLVLCDDVTYTYGEGAFIADRIAKSLKDCGAGKQDSIAFLVPRSELYMFSILAIASAGGVYVPLDDNLPDERIGFMINDADCKIILVSDETYDRAYNLTQDCIILNISDNIKDDIDTLSALPAVCGDLACILYTSGTTGIPKGVKITRKSMVNVVEYYADNYGLTSGDVYALFSAIGFDVSNFVICAVLYSGCCLSVIPQDIRFNMSEMNRYFIKHGVTHTFITTQVGKLFMETNYSSSLDVLLVAGEKLGDVENPSDYEIVDGFGPTEAFAFMSSIHNSQKINPSSVGYLNYNMKAYVLDNEARRVPYGAVGELYVSGYQVADGYLNREEETENAFIKNPFDDDPDYNVLYRTGDMVRILPDDSFGLVGRRDSQVKIRGNRVELSEIETVIREIDYISDVTVQTVKNGENNEVVAYVVVSQKIDDLKDSVCKHVSRHKPDYMIPSYVIKLDSIPLNVNGKVDKRALPDVNIGSLQVEYVAPRDENEKEIVKAFEKALDLDNVGIYDDFIRLGGDSLTAIKLLNYIESDDVSMADIFTFRTPEAIAKNMSDYSFDSDIYSLEEGCPLNSAQINVFADVIGYNKHNAYHVPGHIRISKEYGLEKILDSLDELLKMHPILSMHISEKYEASEKDISNSEVIGDLINLAKKFGMKKIMDIIRNFGIRNVNGLYKMLKTLIRLFKGEYPYMVMGDKPPISVESKFDQDIIIDFFSESFNFYNNLSKFMIIESENSYYLFYLVHHVIFDAISAGVFKRHFLTLLDGDSIDFDDTFLKSSAFTHQILNSEKFDEASEFYHSFLSDLDDVGTLMEDNSSGEGYKTSSYDLEFDKLALKSFLLNSGISENVLFTSVFSYALSQFVNGNKVIFIISENGRDRFKEDFIDMTANVMPVVIDCKDQSINSYLENVSDNVYEVLRHSYYPLLLLYQKYDVFGNVVFQFVPNWIADDFTDDTEDIEGIKFDEISNFVLNNFSDYLAEFFVQVYQNGDDYTLFITHSKKYSDKMVEEFKNTFMTILDNLISGDMSNLRDTLTKE